MSDWGHEELTLIVAHESQNRAMFHGEAVQTAHEGKVAVGSCELDLIEPLLVMLREPSRGHRGLSQTFGSTTTQSVVDASPEAVGQLYDGDVIFVLGSTHEQIVFDPLNELE